jgi:hypothetical protein
LYVNAAPETAVVKDAVYSSTLMVVVRVPPEEETSVIVWSAAAFAATGAKSASAPRRVRRGVRVIADEVVVCVLNAGAHRKVGFFGRKTFNTSRAMHARGILARKTDFAHWFCY